MDTTNQVQIPDEDVCISHNANNFGKDMHQTILHSIKMLYRGKEKTHSEIELIIY